MHINPYRGNYPYSRECRHYEGGLCNTKPKVWGFRRTCKCIDRHNFTDTVIAHCNFIEKRQRPPIPPPAPSSYKAAGHSTTSTINEVGFRY